MTDEQQIHDLIHRWATAVHAADLEAVLADHAPGIVMFDVPPPEQGLRGLDAYRDSWPGFFQWQSTGALFEIESLEVTAGPEVAFAFALLRCGTPADFARVPDRRLRLTLGLTKTGGRWSVTHEHHSFTDRSTAPEIAATEIRTVHEQWTAQTATKDLDGLMSTIAPEIVSYEHAGQLEYVGVEEVREVCRQGLESTPEEITFDTPALTIHVDGDLAVSWGLDRISTDGVEDRSRGTRVFQRREGGWQLIHQHLSHPAVEK
ncbi:YybH family protein [Crossiella cryophila]|uniref:Uncharacterized protein (TIGR02246 family) n=1 Tax=Crossiella cryophila TaxID=43355 RepID=A0A7W7CEX2_9PSEU|nr:nuclear transport factor 2 family protein [Crossiella cryophila]MBB4678616.1 uncharacterized protein (TIGR02246 family) [Crossiella cryophila]